MSQIIIATVVLIMTAFIAPVNAEQYMKRGASAEDYEQALNRVLARKRGLVTGRERPPITTVPATVSPKSASHAKKTVRSAAPPPAVKRAPAAAKSAPAQRVTPARRVTPTAPKVRRSTAVIAGGAAAAAVGGAAAIAATRGAATPVDTNIYQPPPTVNSNDATTDGVSIYFGFNTAQITPDAAAALDRLGTALAADQFREVTWLIEGHTDAAGADAYNLQLSAQRADAVAHYLVEHCGLNAAQLQSVGRGETMPYLTDNPYASANRRVRIRPIDG